MSPCLVNIYAENIMWNAKLHEAQAVIKIVGRKINIFRYVDDTILRAKNEGPKSLLRVKEKREKAGLKLNIQKTKIMASGPITSWQIDWGKVETVTDFIFLGSKVTLDGDYSLEIKRHLLLGKKAMTKLDNILENRNITFANKDPYSQSYSFFVVMHGCDCWTIKKVEQCKIDAHKLWCRRRFLKVPWTARKSISQS